MSFVVKFSSKYFGLFISTSGEWYFSNSFLAYSKAVVSVSYTHLDVYKRQVINPGKEYASIETKTLLLGHDGVKYQSGENRTTIWTKYKIVEEHKTFDSYTAVCAQIETQNLSLIHI